MPFEFSSCKFYDHLNGNCLAWDCSCESCFKVDECSNLLRSVDCFLECFHKFDDACKDRALSYIYAKFLHRKER